MISISKCRLLLSGRIRSLSKGAALSLLLTGSPAFATVTDFAKNGDFASDPKNGQLGFNISVPDWLVTPWPGSYVFLWNPGSGTSGATADTTGAQGVFTDPATNPVKLWGPGTGSPNGLKLSPAGGAIIGATPAFHNGAISQALTDLTPNAPVIVTFDWAGAQQFGFDGSSEEGWAVSLGGQTFDTAPVSIGSHGFSGWTTALFSFTPTSASETLSFLAIGSTKDVQGFALLSGVKVDPIPEPSTWAMMLLGLAGLGFIGYRRTYKGNTTTA